MALEHQPTQRRLTFATGVVAHLSALFTWQSGLIVQKLLVGQSNVFTVMTLQLCLAAVVLWIVHFCIRGIPPFTVRTLLNVCWGLMAPGLVFAVGIAGAARTDGVSIALIWGLFPLIGPIIARILIGEPARFSVFAGGAVAFAGIVLLTLSRSEAEGSDVAGNILVLAAVVLAATNATIGRVLNRGQRRGFEVATLQVTGAAIGSLLLLPVMGWKPPPLDATSNLLALAYLVMFMTVFNFVLYNLALGRISVAIISLNASIAPLFGIVASWLILGSVLTPTDLMVAMVILTGVAIPHVFRLRRARSGEFD